MPFTPPENTPIYLQVFLHLPIAHMLQGKLNLLPDAGLEPIKVFLHIPCYFPEPGLPALSKANNSHLCFG